MKLLVGLGNIGEKYENTRHNLGFMVLDYILRNIDPELKFEEDKKNRAEVKKVDPYLLCKPTTFMNNSGSAVASVLSYYRIDINDLIVIYDDVDLPIGKIRIKKNGGSAGHKGVESIIESIKTDNFLRIRVGIGRPKNNAKEVEDYVLERFTKEEKGQIQEVISRVAEIVEKLKTKSVSDVMTEYNS